jgi:uncharacterized protein YjhX (UPF0386 family)
LWKNPENGRREECQFSDLVKFYEIWASWKDAQLTEREKEMLVAALHKEGKIYVFGTSAGEFVRAGSLNCIDEADPSVRARALEAFEKLARRGLIRHESGQLFCLSGSGFDVARKLAESHL